jgi:hypothetical protein
MADYVYDWGDSKGWVGKTLKQMWHEERGAVVWACENFDKLHDKPWGPDFYDAVAEVRLISQSGRFKKQDNWNSYKVSRSLLTKRCGCDKNTECEKCEGWDSEDQREDDGSDGDESEPCAVECEGCGEGDAMPSDGLCWKCTMDGPLDEPWSCETDCSGRRCRECSIIKHSENCSDFNEEYNCHCGDEEEEMDEHERHVRRIGTLPCHSETKRQRRW